MEQIYFDIAKAIKENPISMSSRTQFRGLLSDYQMDKLRMNLLLAGYDAALHLYLKSDIDINAADYVRHRRNLVDNFGLTEEHAKWVVNTWVEFYAVEVLGKDVSDFLVTKKVIEELRNVTDDDVHDYPEIPGAKKYIDGNDLDMLIDDLDLSVRSYNCLRRTGINTVGELFEAMRQGPERMYRIRNLGRKAIEEVLAKVKEISPTTWAEFEKACEDQKEEKEEIEVVDRMGAPRVSSEILSRKISDGTDLKIPDFLVKKDDIEQDEEDKEKPTVYGGINRMFDLVDEELPFK